MPKTKRIDPEELRAAKLKKKRRAIRERIADSPDSKEINQFVGEYLASVLIKDSTFSVENPCADVLEDMISKLTSTLVKPYADCQFNLSKVVKRSVENWLHSKHHKGDMSLKEVGELIGRNVVESAVHDIESSVRPWFPNHETGKVAWKGILDIIGILNSEENTGETKANVLKLIKEPEKYVEILSKVLSGDYAINPCFDIEPGYALEWDFQ